MSFLVLCKNKIAAIARSPRIELAVVGLLASFVLGQFAFASSSSTTDTLNETPKELESVGIDEHLGEQVDLDLMFTNEMGESVPLKSFFRDHRPVLLNLAYYNCPNLCNFQLNGMNDAFRSMEGTIGEEFQVVTVSIEPKETPELAASKKANYLARYGKPGADKGWHFLVGQSDQISQLAQQVGFKYHWDDNENQWAHAAAAYVLTPDGRISRYLYGVYFDPQALRLSLVEASDGKIGSIVDKLILFCFHFDPKASKYTLYATNIMRAGGVGIVAVLAAFLIPVWFRTRREEKRIQGEA